MEFRIVGLPEVADGPRSVEPRSSSCAHCSQSFSCTPMVVSADALVEALRGTSGSAANTLRDPGRRSSCGAPVVVGELALSDA